MLDLSSHAIDRIEEGATIPLELAPLIDDALQLSSVYELFEQGRFAGMGPIFKPSPSHQFESKLVPNLTLAFSVPTGKFTCDSVGNPTEDARDIIVLAIAERIPNSDRFSIRAECLKPTKLPPSITSKTDCSASFLDPQTGRVIAGRKFNLTSMQQWHVHAESRLGCRIEGWLD